MKKETLRNGIKVLQKAGFPGERKFDKLAYDVWANLLHDINDDDFMRTVKECALTLKYFPTIAEIRERALKRHVMLSAEAWTEVLGEMEKVCGRGIRPSFSTPLIERAVRSIGGLDTIWKAGIDQETYYRMNFIKAYDAMVQRKQQEDILGLPTKEDATKILEDFGLKMKSIKEDDK